MKDFFLKCCIFKRQILYKRVPNSFAATTVRSLDISAPTVIQKPLPNTVARNTLSESAQKQKLKSYKPIAKETTTQILLNVPNTENINKLCMEIEGSHHPDNRTLANKNYGSIIEINICGFSDHSRIAIDRYLDQCKPEVVILNETTKSIPENTFNNYMIFSKISIHSTGGVAIIIRSGSSFARMEELENSNSNNLVISTNCGGLRVLVTITYVKPDNRDKLQCLIQDLDVGRKYTDSNRLDGVIFFGDCNARHFYWGDHFCNQLGQNLNNILPIFNILNEGKPPVRTINGYSVTDLCT